MVAMSSRVCIRKDPSSSSDVHRFGIARDDDADGTVVVWERATSHPHMVVRIVESALWRYYQGGDRYRSRVEHTVDVAIAACILLDTLVASSADDSRASIAEDVASRLRAELSPSAHEGGAP